MLRAFDKLCKRSDCITCGSVIRIIDLDHDFEVTLYNYCAIRIHRVPNLVI